MSVVEPRIWSQVTDSLPVDHPLANVSVNCTNCAEMVHAFNNENMQEWVETGKGAWCLDCFIGVIWNMERQYHEIDEEWGLPS